MDLKLFKVNKIILLLVDWLINILLLKLNRKNYLEEIFVFLSFVKINLLNFISQKNKIINVLILSKQIKIVLYLQF